MRGGTSPVGVFWDSRLKAYDMGRGHLMRPERAEMAMALLSSYGLFSDGTLERQGSYPVSRRDLLLVHDAAYLDALGRAGDNPEGWSDGAFGIHDGETPAFPGMLDAARDVCGATLAAVNRAVGGGMAFAPAGGLHHARRSAAAGFCVLNDIAVAIAVALRDHWGLRVAYIDVDAHHGDGVQNAFWNEPRVLTISLHCSGLHLYPGTGFHEETGGDAAPGSAANVPLPMGADDTCYRVAWEGLVDPLVRAWGPDVIVAQLGADALGIDSLAPLEMTLRGHERLTAAVVSLARTSAGGRLAATGGGGYGLSLGAPRAWAMAAANMAGVRLPDCLPETWGPAAARDAVANLGLDELPQDSAERLRGMVDAVVPRSLRDDRGYRSRSDRERVLAATEESIERTRKALFPLWGLRP